MPERLSKSPLARLRDEVRDLRLPKPPFWAVSLAIIAIVASWIPLAFIARAWFTRSPEQRIHLIQDMDNQPKFKAQQANTLFADERAARPKILGTVARGHLQADDHFYRGFRRAWNEQTQKFEVTFFDTFPDALAINEQLLRRGQLKYAIHCSACHGLDGRGNGSIHVRVTGREPAWVPPSNLLDETPRTRPVGHLYNTINNGIRNMPGYGYAITPADQWAIVAYVKTLQFAQRAPVNLVPAEKLSALREQ